MQVWKDFCQLIEITLVAAGLKRNFMSNQQENSRKISKSFAES
jgi:hypothetical protein